MRSLTVFLVLVLVGAATPTAWAFGQKQHAAISDDAIYDKVKRKLADDALVKGAALEVEVHDGAVTLKGRVAGKKEKSKAEKLTKKVSGVKSVDNQLVISTEENPQG